MFKISWSPEFSTQENPWRHIKAMAMTDLVCAVGKGWIKKVRDEWWKNNVCYWETNVGIGYVYWFDKISILDDQ